ncbi:endo-beta-N-acetylglucosaminidase [Shouchella shacheensis]|uniref:endo-beta-N-acetylglucosaminidase n=1 Tax=Shouchella shacheensis TaxID=1649580 RepID=UPI0007400B8A|nr:discoidin domain-containing protein [Shouchella shacheensis]
MGKKRVLFVACFVLVVLASLFPNKGMASTPESSYWYPEELLEWNPEQDPDAEFNRSTVPLVERDSIYPSNDTQQEDAKLVALSALNQNTSGVPSQGGKDFFANTFSFWQYVDLMVYWAGSAGEGIITPPSADVTDAAHRNGVQMLGNVFFPPQVYGGQEEWVEQMLTQREDGSFPAADKLLEVAEYYGFDGWFINQETEGGDVETAEKMQGFLTYLQDHKPEGMHIMWYDSMISTGEIRWQNYLTDNNKMFLQDQDTRVADSMFLNFWWSNESQERSHDKAVEIERNPYDLYAGIDVEASGTSTDVNWGNVFPDDHAPFASLGIYRPDWAFNSSSTMDEFYQKEEEFWVGEKGDPRFTNENERWKGMAHYFTEKTVVNELPFTTHFNTGSGTFFAVDGAETSNQSWNNRSLQDILPTWRWIAESEGEPLDVDFDWDEAYYGGSSLQVSGALSEENATHVKLYKTKLTVEKHTEIALTYKTTEKDTHMKVGVSFADAPEEFTFFDVKKKSHGDWRTDWIKLHKFEGKEIVAISLFFDSKAEIEDYQMNIGELAVYNKHDRKQAPKAPTRPEVIDTVFEDGLYADVELTWEHDEEIRHYEIYRQLSNGEREFLGATPNQVYAISDLRRENQEMETTLEIVAVNEHFVRSRNHLEVSFDWPEYPVPNADFNVSKTVAQPGEEIEFYNRSSEVTEEVEWHFEGGEPSFSDEENPIIRYEQEGTYSVTLTAKNTEGEDVLAREGYITITEEAQDIVNVALKKEATASGQCAASEGPMNAIDGKVTDNSKWCAIGTDHWLQVDLLEEYDLSSLVVKHAEAGGEPSAFNTRAFTIETSLDGEQWDPLVSVDNNTEGVSEHTIPLTTARYIRLSVQQPTQGGDQAVRIYELEAYGY